ncbi:MAG: hypothetical protein IKH57_08075, partial [Clostridia bacterium]|nr:hypothetical protein [Clostridia bacterium]
NGSLYWIVYKSTFIYEISCEKSSISFTAPFRLREPLRLGGSASAGLFLLKDTSFSDIMAVKG